MKITVIDGPDGRSKQIIDFQGAELPNGRSIQAVLNENEKLKENISSLQKEMVEKSSIFAKLIPWKSVRDSIEVIMFIFGVIGIIQLFT